MSTHEYNIEEHNINKCSRWQFDVSENKHGRYVAQVNDGDLRVNSKKIFPDRSQLRWESVVSQLVDRRKDDVHFLEMSAAEWH